MQGFDKNPVAIDVLTRPWAAKSWCLSMCISPKFKLTL